tara:strand:+ start:3032 stop:4279 length:1248 start_codon:yes stop_codon:yes gene_type:complete
MNVWGHSRALEKGWNLLKIDEDILAEKPEMPSAQERLNVFEGFAGGGGNPDIHAGWSQAARDRGHNVKTGEIMYAGNPNPKFDVDLGYMPDLPGDIMDYTADDIIRLYGGNTPDVSYWSPPCEGHSIAAGFAGWDDWAKQDAKKNAFNRARNTGDFSFFDDPSVGPTPSNESALQGRELMNKVWEIIDGLQDYRTHHEGRDKDDPMRYWVENPTGMMRFQPEMAVRPMVQPQHGQPYHKRLTGQAVPAPSITHSSYSGPFAEALGFPAHPIPGHGRIPARKRTDLWSNARDIWFPRPQTLQGLHHEAPELDMSLEELQSIFGNKVEEIPDRPSLPSPAVGDASRSGAGGHAGVYHTYGPRGSRTGTQGIEDWVMPDGTVIPKYQMRSLIPYGLGEDTIRAVERALRGEGQQGRLF